MSTRWVDPPNHDARGRVRWAAIVISLLVALCYLALFLTLLTQEKLPDDPTPVFAFLAAVYIVGTVVLVLRDGPVLYWIGVAVQLVVLALYVGITVIGEPAFAQRFITFGIIISVAQVVLVIVLTYLVLRKGAARSAARPASDLSGA